MKTYLTLLFILFLSFIFLIELCKSDYNSDLDVGKRIIEGWYTGAGEFQHVVAIDKWVFYLIFWTFRCGGSIIHKYWVISSAQCFDESASYRIIAGTHQRSILWEPNENIHIVQGVHIKDDYEIALVHLKDAIDISNRKKTISLPNTNDVEADVASDRRAYIFGWGYTKPNSWFPSYYLKGANVSITSSKDCTDLLESRDGSYYVCSQVTSEYIDSPCIYDHGAGLIRDRTNSSEANYLTAVLINTSSDCTVSIYIRVSPFKGWILEIIMKYTDQTKK